MTSVPSHLLEQLMVSSSVKGFQFLHLVIEYSNAKTETKLLKNIVY